MRIKKVLGIMMIALTLLLGCNRVDAQENIEVKLNDVTITKQAFIEKGTTYVPVRVISEKLGAIVAWDNKTSTATITKGDKKAVVRIGNNGILKSSTTFVPVRFVSETLGATVVWEDKTSTVLISTGSPAEQATTKILIDGKEVPIKATSSKEIIKPYQQINAALSKIGTFTPQHIVEFPDEIFARYYTVQQSEIGPDNYDFAIYFYLDGSENHYGLVYLISIEEFTEQGYKGIKEVLKALYPTQYERAYKEVTEAIKNETDGKKLILDGRSFDTRYFGNGATILIGGIKK